MCQSGYTICHNHPCVFPHNWLTLSAPPPASVPVHPCSAVFGQIQILNKARVVCLINELLINIETFCQMSYYFPKGSWEISLPNIQQKHKKLSSYTSDWTRPKLNTKFTLNHHHHTNILKRSSLSRRLRFASPSLETRPSLPPPSQPTNNN